MTSTKNITSLARKWQKRASMRRRTVLLPKTDKEADIENSRVAQKSHFVVYTNDQNRFEFPFTYLKTDIFQELLKLSEEEFGLSSDGPITFPCDALFMDYIVSLIKRGGAECIEKDFPTYHCTFSDTFPHGSKGQRSVVCGY